MRIDIGNLPDLKEQLKRKIDEDAEAVRAQVITLGAGQAMVYEQKRREADIIMEAIASGQPITHGDVPMLAVEAADLGTDLQGAATAVIIAAHQWLQIGAMIEQKRLSGKRAVDSSVSVPEARTAANIDWSLPIP